VVVPEAAIRTDGGQSVAFVFKGDAVERRAVRLGGRRSSGVEVVAGLRAGERVVVEGPDDLSDGDRVAEAGSE
jgi:multidrug efflux pump subunit AcrA (membrane-fusion protein)